MGSSVICIGRQTLELPRVENYNPPKNGPTIPTGLYGTPTLSHFGATLTVFIRVGVTSSGLSLPEPHSVRQSWHSSPSPQPFSMLPTELFVLPQFSLGLPH